MVELTGCPQTLQPHPLMMHHQDEPACLSGAGPTAESEHRAGWRVLLTEALAAEAEGAVREPLSLCGEVGDFGEPE